MNRRAVLGLVGCGVGTVATGRGVSRAACDGTGDAGSAPVPRWVFPAGDYRIGIDSHADRSARLIVFATASEPERSFALPPPPHARRRSGWVPVAATADQPDRPTALETALPGEPPDPGEARIVFDQEPGLTTYVDCCGIGIAGRAYTVASVSGTGPTYLVRLDPAVGALATLAISRRALSVVALYRRPAQNALCVVIADGKDVIVRDALA
jgi:hypothetical protein